LKNRKVTENHSILQKSRHFTKITASVITYTFDTVGWVIRPVKHRLRK